MIQKYNEFLNEKLTDTLRGFDEEGLKQQLIDNKIDIFKYLQFCEKYNLEYPSNEELINYFKDYTFDKIIKTLISIGNKELIKYYIDDGNDINAHSSYALRIAVNKNDIKIVKFLIDNNAEITQTVVENAIDKDNDLSKYLIDICKIDILNKILHYIVIKHNFELLKYTVEHGADIKSDNSLFYTAVQYNDHKIVEYLIEHDADTSDINKALQYVINYQSNELAKYLMKYANIHYNDDKPIKLAIDRYNIDIITYMLDNYEFPNINSILDYTYKKGHGIFVDKIVKLLIEHGAVGDEKVTDYYNKFK